MDKKKSVAPRTPTRSKPVRPVPDYALVKPEASKEWNFHCMLFFLMAYRFDPSSSLLALPNDVILYIMSFFQVEIFFEYLNQAKKKVRGSVEKRYSIISGPDITGWARTGIIKYETAVYSIAILTLGITSAT